MFAKSKIEIIKLEERCSLLQQQVERLEQQLKEKEADNRRLYVEVSRYENELNKKAEHKNNLVQKEKTDQEQQETWLRNFNNNVHNYYTLKESIFYTNEQLVFYCLNNIFKNKTWNSKKYSIFPKVRIADYIEPLPNDNNLRLPDNLYRSVLKIVYMHTDFLICEIIPDGHNTKYKPVLVIEINGESHTARLDVQKNDEFKSALFKAYGIKQISHKIIGTVGNLGNLQSLLEERIKDELLID